MRSISLLAVVLCCFGVARSAEAPSKGAEAESIKTAQTEAEKITGLSREGVYRKYQCELFFYSSLADGSNFGKLQEADRTQLGPFLGDDSFFLHRFSSKDPKKSGFEIFVSDDGTKILWKRTPVAEQQTVTQLLQRIRSQLPKGWTASYDKEDSWLEVTRTESVLLLHSIPNQSPFAEPEPGTFTIAFRVVPYTTRSHYRRLKKENDRLQTEADALREKLSRTIRHHRYSFQPSNEAEKQEVERYEQTKRSIRPLPDYYFRNISLQWEFPPWSRYPYSGVQDKAIRDECEQTQRKILKLLSRYDTE